MMDRMYLQFGVGSIEYIVKSLLLKVDPNELLSEVVVWAMA
jgi:hypothetical protein